MLDLYKKCIAGALQLKKSPVAFGLLLTRCAHISQCGNSYLSNLGPKLNITSKCTAMRFSECT